MLPRVAILGVAMLLAALPVWLTVLVDYEGFGGFPHRVNDEVGPGYHELLRWQDRGAILDFQRPGVLTWLVPPPVLFARAAHLRWPWPPALVRGGGVTAASWAARRWIDRRPFADLGLDLRPRRVADAAIGRAWPLATPTPPSEAVCHALKQIIKPVSRARLGDCLGR